VLLSPSLQGAAVGPPDRGAIGVYALAVLSYLSSADFLRTGALPFTGSSAMDALVGFRSFASRWCGAALLAACGTMVAYAQEFRIETEVYLGDAAEPASQTVTLFEKSAVYEFTDNPRQTIVYRESTPGKPGQFILLDPAAQRRTDVEADRVSKLMDKLAGWAAEQKDPLLKFAADPAFEETFDADTGDLTLANKQWTYRVATVAAEDKAALERYRAFTDRYAELMSMMENSPPPRPRLALNAALEKHGVVPVEIRRTIAGDDKNQVRAAHLFSWRLSREDRQKLDEARQQLASFTKVDNKAFLASRKKEDVVRGQSK
jgi:hypothetical protein